MTKSDPKDQAFAALVDRYLDRVFRYLRNLTRSEEAARELAHETFLRLRDRVSPDDSPSEAYVFTTARNTALSRWRRLDGENRKLAAVTAEGHAAEGTWLGTQDRATPSREVERGDLRRGLEEALAKLTEDQRSVFLLSTVEGLKYDRIAEIMGIPAGTVASRKNSATRFLREELERTGHAL